MLQGTQVLSPLLVKYVMCFDDILIFSSCLQDHLAHSEHALTIFKARQHYINQAKCLFLKKGVYFWALSSLIKVLNLIPPKSKLFRIALHISQNFSKVRSFHDLAMFYWWFIWNFSTIIALVTECLKSKNFSSSAVATKALSEIKEKIGQAPVLKLLDFSKVFEMTCDASYVGIVVS